MLDPFKNMSLIAVPGIVLTVFGWYLAFKSSIILGILTLFTSPFSGLLFGSLQIFTGENLPARVVGWFN